MDDHDFMKIAIDEGAQGLAAGGVPVGAALVADGKVLGSGHNKRVQQRSRANLSPLRRLKTVRAWRQRLARNAGQCKRSRKWKKTAAGLNNGERELLPSGHG